MIFRNARLIFADGIREGLEIVTQQGKIAEIRQQTKAPANDIANLDGNYLAPGFVDLHVHGAMGRDTMEASEEAFRTICDYHATGGTTSLLVTTATAPTKSIIDVVNSVRDCRASIKQIAGVHVEGPFISKAKAGAQRVSLIRKPTSKACAPFLKHCDVIKRMTIAPEVPGATELIDNLRENGVSVSGGHSDAWEGDGRTAFEHGMRNVTHSLNCRSTTGRRGIEWAAWSLESALSAPASSCAPIAAA